MGRISTERIAGAMEVIDPVFLHSPQIDAPELSDELGLRLVVKAETLNPIRSFKGRGADFLVKTLADPGPLVCASAGNFGQGLAYAASRRGLPLTVFAAETANELKVRRMKALGAEIVRAGRDFDAAKDAARAHAGRVGARFVEDGREAAGAEGAGTIALELLRRPETFDALLVPLGNGALLAGIATWAKAHSPATRVIGVCAAGAPAMERSWRSDTLVTTPESRTIADGIGVRVPVPEALGDLRGLIDDVLLVDDAATLAAMRRVLATLGLLVEPSGAVGVAAASVFRERFAGQTVGTVLCGGNVTDADFRAWFGGGA